MRLDGAVAVVTGASSGIGRATALALARRGARVLVLARSESKLEDLVAEIEGIGGRAAAYPVDLADPDAALDVASRIEVEHGAPDLVVNNAGAGRWLAVEETPPAEVLAMLGAPYLAAFHLTRAFLPAMIARGSGRFVQVNSPACLVGFPGAAGYSASRAALRSFDESLGQELRGTGVGVTHLIAGETSSAYFEHNPDSHERLPAVARWFRVVTPDQVAAAIVAAVERDRRRASLPLELTATLAVHAVAPWLVKRLVLATAWRRPRAIAEQRGRGRRAA